MLCYSNAIIARSRCLFISCVVVLSIIAMPALGQGTTSPPSDTSSVWQQLELQLQLLEHRLAQLKLQLHNLNHERHNHGQGAGSPGSSNSGTPGSSGSGSSADSGGTISGSGSGQGTTPLNGICGSSNGLALSSKPTGNLCATGTAATVSGSGPWTWSCSGSNGGTSAQCTASLKPTPINGACGSSNGQSLSSKPATNLCNSGTTSIVNGSGPWSWSCSGSNGGTSAQCTASLKPTAINGACGPANSEALKTAPTTNLCSSGTPTAVTTDGSSWIWQCVGSAGGNVAACVAQDTATTPTGRVGGGTTTTRNYLNGVMANPADNSTPALMGYAWDYTIGGSYQDNCAGCGVWGVSQLNGYPVIIDLWHVQSSYPDYNAAANGGYNALYQQTAQALTQYAGQIYGVRIDSEFNGSWSAATAFGSSTIDTLTWIAGFRNMAAAIRSALPNAKIIWNPNISQNNPFPYYPGDDVVDAIGPDIYCMPQYYSTSAECWNDYLNGANGNNLSAYSSFSNQHNKPIVIPEWGDGFGDGYMIQQMRAWMDSNNVVAHSYWDSADALSSTASLTVQTTDQQAYATAFGHRAYTGTYWQPFIPVPAGATATPP